MCYQPGYAWAKKSRKGEKRMPYLFWVVPFAGVLTVLFVIILARNILRSDTGTPKMREIGDLIFESLS